MGILEEEVGQVFVKVLEDAGVYKCTKEGRDALNVLFPYYKSRIE